MPRLLTVIHTPVFGGPHNQVARLAAPLAAHGWETLTVLPDEPASGAPRMRAMGAEVLQIPLHRLRAQLDPRPHLTLLASGAPEVAHLRRIIRERQIDMVQVGGLMNPHAALAARLENIPVVWLILGTTAPPLLRRALMPLVGRLADALLVTGQRVARLHPGALAFGERLITFFPPVEPGFFANHAARRAAARAELGLPPDALVIGTVGNRNKLKGHEFLLRAAAPLHAQYPNLHTCILGAPTTHADYYEQVVLPEARALGLLDSGRLHWVDPGMRVVDLIAALDIFLLTSRKEGVPTVILEAMATGLPVVSTNVGSIGEIIAHGGTGLLVPPGDHAAIARATGALLARPALRAQMGHLAYEQASQHYTLEQCVALHLHAYAAARQHWQQRQRPAHTRGAR